MSILDTQPAYHYGGLTSQTRSDENGEEYQHPWGYWRLFSRGRIQARMLVPRPDRDSDYFLEDKDEWADPEEWI